MRYIKLSIISAILFFAFFVGVNSTIQSVQATDEPELHSMSFGPNGWAGWSCSEGTTVVGGGYEPSDASVQNSLAWEPGATVGEFSYPTTPFGYTYAEGETGWIVQNDNDQEDIDIFVECEAEVTPTPTEEVTPTPTEEPECDEDICEPEPEPEPEQPGDDRDLGSPRPSGQSSTTQAPVCTNGVTVNVVANPHVLRAGDHAIVNFFITEGNVADVLYKEVNASDWQHAVSDLTPNADRFVSVDIGGLDPNLGYTFGVRQRNGCGGGTVTAVVVDSNAPQLFQLSYYEMSE